MSSSLNATDMKLNAGSRHRHLRRLRHNRTNLSANHDPNSDINADSDAECPTPAPRKTWLATMGPWARVYYDHQIDVPLFVIIATLVARYCLPLEGVTSIANGLLFPSHAVLVEDSPDCGPSSSCVRYAKGPMDFAFVAFYFCVMALLRAVCLRFVLKPIAHKLGCAGSKIPRFCEQGWLAIYYTCTFTIGMKLIMDSPIWIDTKNLWVGYPHWHHSAAFKSFYLVQLSFWLQQLAIVHVEKPRKDKNTFIAHHVVTCLMIVGSYATNYVRLGICVFASFDVADILLSAAKCLVYVELHAASNTLFALFVLVWFYSRHYIYTYLVYLFAFEAPRQLEFGKLDVQGGYFAARSMHALYLCAFITLQLMVSYWSFLIFKMVVRVAKKIPGDMRSDDEEEDDDDDAEVQVKQQQQQQQKAKSNSEHCAAEEAPCKTVKM